MIFLPTALMLWFHIGNLSLGNHNVKKFPVKNAPPGCAKFVDQSKMSDDHARHNHAMGLERLAVEGGLTVDQIARNIRRLSKYAACPDALDVVNLFAAE
jgi:hypothetical protein